MPLLPFDTFEKSCSEFAIVFTLFVPLLLFFALLITVLVKKFAQKQPWDAIKFYVYHLIALGILLVFSFFLYSKVPGIFCGFFIVYLIFLFVQPFLSIERNNLVY